MYSVEYDTIQLDLFLSHPGIGDKKERENDLLFRGNKEQSW